MRIKRSLSVWLPILGVSFQTLALAADVAASDVPPQSVSITAQGRNGAHGRSGQNGSDGSSGGGHGDRGGDATEAVPGQNAGDIQITLQPVPGADGKPLVGQLRLTGTVKDPNTGVQGVSTNKNLGHTEFVHLSVRGGDGGNGGNGGNGGDGGRGSDGIGATRYSSGTSGGNGGNGGDGGKATSGKAGGAGGTISVSVPEQNADLLMLIGNVDVSGGKGGRAGSNGRGGSGGQGGSGGSGYSWCDSVASGRDSNGNTTYTTQCGSQPGGFDGSRGSDGSNGNARVSDGQDGRSGNFKIHVLSAGGEKTYDSRYDLEVVGFDLEDENHDGIFEFGERGIVKNIRVRNKGGMPTPKNQPVEITVPNGSWLTSREQKLVISQQINPGQTVTLPGNLPFVLNNLEVTEPSNRVVRHDTTSPEATQTGVDRKYASFVKPKAFDLTFPIEITPIQGAQSLLPGQTAKIAWKVRNISGRDFGSLSDLKREIATELKVDPTKITTKDFEFTDAQGRKVSLDDGFLTQIASLKSGEEMVIEGNVSLKKNAVPYEKVALNASLQLGKIDAPADKRPVQFQDIMISVSHVYKKSDDSSLLLVTNNHTKKEEVDAWLEKARSMGIKADVWDTSYEGFLAFNRALSNGSTLGKDFNRKTVVLLNNDRPLHKHEDDGLKVQADSMIPKKELLRAAAEDGITFYMVGKDKDHNEKTTGFFLLPTGQTSMKTFGSREEFLSAMSKGKFDMNTLQAGQIAVKDHYYFSDPSEEDLKKKAQEVADDLHEKNPAERYYVAYKYDGSPDRKKSGFGQDVNLGTITIGKSLPTTKNYITAMPATNDELHSPDFVKGVANTRALLSAMSIEQKMDIFSKYARGQIAKDPKMENALKDSIIEDIATEQISLRKNDDSFWGSHFRNELKTLRVTLEGLNQAMAQAGAQAGQNPNLGAARAAAVEILAKIRVLSNSENPWYKLGLFSNNVRISNQTNSMLEDALDKTFDGKDLHQWARTQYDAQVKTLTANHWMDYGDSELLQRAVAQINPTRITRDSTLATGVDDRIMTRGVYEGMVKGKAWVKENQAQFDERRQRERAEIEKQSASAALP